MKDMAVNVKKDLERQYTEIQERICDLRNELDSLYPKNRALQVLLGIVTSRPHSGFRGRVCDVLKKAKSALRPRDVAEQLFKSGEEPDSLPHLKGRVSSELYRMASRASSNIRSDGRGFYVFESSVTDEA